MDPHLSSLISSFGPAILYGLGAVLLFGARAILKSLDRVLKNNSQAHEQMLEQLSQHQLKLAGHDMRLDDHGREHLVIRERADSQQETLRSISERLTRIEARDNFERKYN